MARRRYQEGQFRVLMYDPARALAEMATDYVRVRASQMIFEQGELQISFSIRSPLATHEYNGSTAMAQDWANFSFDVYWDTYKIFSGPVSVAEITHDGTIGSAKVNLSCTTWFNWLLGGRTIETADGGNYVKTTVAWDDIWRDLIRTNCVAASAVAPSEYPHADSERGDFGPFTVAVGSDTSTASTATFKVQSGKPLLDTALEMCNTPPAEADMLYPTVSETSPGTFQFDVAVGRSGGSRGIGTDLSSSVVVSGARGGTGGFKKRVEHNMAVSVAKCGGAGRGAGQRRRYATDSATKTLLGIREDGVTIPKGVVNAQLDNEAQKQIWEQKNENVKHWEFQVVEDEGSIFGSDYQIRDTITAHDLITGETVARIVVGVEAIMVSPGPPVLKLIFGKMPRHSARENGRSGGGSKGGGRSGGGPPKDSEGDSEQDADDILTFLTIGGDSGVDAVADVYNDRFDLVSDPGRGADTELHILHVTSNDPEVGILQPRANITGDLAQENGNVYFTGFFYIEDTGGTKWKVWVTPAV